MTTLDTNNNMKFLALLVFVTWVVAEDYYEDIHNLRYAMHFREIPKRFEVKGGADFANKDLRRYFDEIENIARQENITILYKVKLEIMKPGKHFARKSPGKKLKTKKYNVPLKKNSMKLSTFEVMLRKMAEQSGHANQIYENYMNPSATTEIDRKIVSIKPIQLKYKPIISRVKTNYTKRIKPVRSKIITLPVA